MQFRTCEVLRDGTWTEIEFEQLKSGDLFRLTEPDGTPVLGPLGARTIRANSDPRPVDKQGNWGITSEWIIEGKRSLAKIKLLHDLLMSLGFHAPMEVIAGWPDGIFKQVDDWAASVTLDELAWEGCGVPAALAGFATNGFISKISKT